MAYVLNPEDGSYYDDGTGYVDLVTDDRDFDYEPITYGPGDTYTAEDLVNQNNDFNYADFVDRPQTYRDSDFYEAYLNSGLDPTSSADVTAGMTPVELAALRGYMESQSNANTTGGGPGPATDYLASLVAAVKSGALTSEALKNLSAPVQTAVNKALAATPAAAPSFLDSIGNFLKTPTGQAVGVGGLAALLGSMGNKGTGEIYKGYQGGIPNYSATRTMNAIPTTTTDASGNVVARRPGQGGITYFSPMQYTTAGAATSGTPPSPAAGIAAISPAPTDTVTKAAGGLSSLGGYSAGGRGRLLRGPGDGVSDSIPAIIGRKQPARLADGEFVIPARVVSEIGNGSTEAGARKLYAMMDRVQKARGKTLKNVAANSRADKYLPA